MFDVVLGIDPGVSRCGYGAVARDGSRFTAIACGVIRTPPSEPLPNRLASLAAELDALDRRDAARRGRGGAGAVPGERAAPRCRSGRRAGSRSLIAARRRIPVVQYSPNEVKLAVAGDGGADKREVAEMVARLLGLRRRARSRPTRPTRSRSRLCHWWRGTAAGGGRRRHAGAASRLEAAIAAATLRTAKARSR